jgi:RNA polymerase sigma-70 factor (sigma-E family)
MQPNGYSPPFTGCDYATQTRLLPVSSDYDAEFTQFVTARIPAFRRVAFLLCQDWYRADDLVQAAITRLYMYWDRARAMEHPDAYLRTILVREFLAEQRSGWVRRVVLDVAMPERTAAAADADATLDMLAALAGLPPRQRATLVLRFYCDLSVAETAQLLGCSAGTVKSQTARGIDGLRERLGEAPFPDRGVTQHG